jgi:hypothetical protein
MGARQLLEQALRSGLTLAADGPALVVRPKERLTDDLRAALLAAKPELMALLKEPKQGGQEGQGCQGNQDGQAGTLAGACTDADVNRFLARRDRLMRWGWDEVDAQALAERLTRRDREGDHRVSCAGDCANYRPGRCDAHRRAGLGDAGVGRDFAVLLQRCPGFNPRLAIAQGDHHET